jgi:hypothetical protein
MCIQECVHDNCKRRAIFKIIFIAFNVLNKNDTRHNNNNMSDYESVFVTHCYVYIIALHAESFLHC